MQATLFQVYLSAMHFFICAPCLAFLVFYCFHHNYYCLVSARLVLSKCLVVILTNLSHLYLQLPLLVLHGPYLSQQTPMKIIKMYTALFCPFSVSELIIGNYNFVTCKVLFPYVLSVSVDHQVGFLGEGKTEVCEEHSLGAKEKAQTQPTYGIISQIHTCTTSCMSSLTTAVGLLLPYSIELQPTA